MEKYSTECKLKVVQEYLAGHGSYETLSKRYHVPRTPFQRWVKAYKTFGVDGLKPSHTKKIYTFECKRSAVECYLLTGASYQDVATMFGLNNSILLTRWTKPLSRTRRSQQIQVSSNTGCRVTMGSPSHINCILIRIWISLMRRLSVFTLDRHRLPRGFRAHWTKQFV